jgi:hypothetical protein
MKITYIDNCSHGYLSVSKKDIEKFGLVNHISKFSGMTFTRVYLEEDSDASKFIQALKDNNVPYEFKESYQPSFSISHNYKPELFNYEPEIGDLINEKYKVVEYDKKAKRLHVESFQGTRLKIPFNNPFRYIDTVERGINNKNNFGVNQNG